MYLAHLLLAIEKLKLKFQHHQLIKHSLLLQHAKHRHHLESDNKQCLHPQVENHHVHLLLEDDSLQQLETSVRKAHHLHHAVTSNHQLKGVKFQNH